MNSKVCQFTELCEKKHKSEVKKWNKTSHFYEEMLTYCFGLHWHSVQLKLLKQHENMAFLFLICRAGPGSYLFIIIKVLYMSSSFWLLGVDSREFSQAEKKRSACKAGQIHKMTTFLPQNDNLGPF